ncbi:DUF6233 domain-containing protein [Streptomyces sp. SAI-25]|uniref:DUF6233 domain-containing protein n=1 Tax=Streptomyces sp. SAI-25 TaxID=1472664 RepID=UPI00403A4D47
MRGLPGPAPREEADRCLTGPDRTSWTTIRTGSRPRWRRAGRRVQELEAQEAKERQRREQAYAGRRWKVEPERADAAALLHRGDCATYPVAGGYIDRDHALVALEMPDVEPCQVCRPDTGLTHR